MAESNRPDQDFVDISSSSEVRRVYRPDAAQREQLRIRRRRKSFAIRVTCLVLSILFLAGGSLVVYFYYRMPKYKALSGDIVITDPKATPDEGDNTEPESDPTGLLEHDEVLNILLFGQDYSGSKDEYGRSDTMILMSIDNINRKIKLTSFQRDTYVHIPGYGDDKINAAFSLGGEALAIKTLEQNFRIKVDKYATVDFDSFRKIIKVLGGIDIELTVDEIEYINAQIDVNHQLDRTSFLEYDPYQEKQTVHLDGYQALWYARDRGEERLGGNPNYTFSGDDWDRTHRQRNLIETIIKYLRTKASLSDLIGIVNDVGPLITTNLKKDQILFLATNIMTFISYDMEQMTVPTPDNWRYGYTSDGQSVIVITDWKQVKYDMASFIYESAVVRSETE